MFAPIESRDSGHLAIDLLLLHSLIAASISGKYDFGDLRSDSQQKLLHNCSGMWPEVSHVQ